jgi:carbon-monoxide dehydrogenase small subunit
MDSKKQSITLTVNGRSYNLTVNHETTLLEVLREHLGLTGTKEGCGLGACGACTVLMEGEAVLACTTLAISVEGRNILTVESLGTEDTLAPLQQSLIDHAAIQCGFCTPGISMSATALLNEISHPDDVHIKQAIAGNLCRCTGYKQIVEAIKDTAADTDCQKKI